MNSLLFWLATLVFFCFSCWRLREAVLVLPFFFPFYLVKTSLAGIPFTLIEAFIYVATIAFLLQLIVKKISAEAVFNAWLQHKKLFFYILLFIVGAFLSLLAVKSQLLLSDGHTAFEGLKIALGIIKSWIVTPLILFFLWLAVIYTPKASSIAAKSYTASAFLLALWALWQVLTHTYITPDARASGPFESANYLALYIGPAVVYSWIQLGWSVLQSQKKTIPITLWFIIGGIMSAALLFSKSYAAIFAVVVALGWYIIMQWHQQRSISIANKQTVHTSSHTWYWIGGGCILLSIVTFLIFTLDPGKWQAMFHFEQQNSSSVRIQVYTVAADLLKRNWLLGIGPGQFSAHYDLEAATILGKPPYEVTMLHPHNIILAMWLNLGLLGLAGFIGVIVIAITKIRKALHSHTNPYVIMGGALLIEILIHGLFDTPFFKNDLALLFWLIITIIMVEVPIPTPHPPAKGDDSKIR